MRYFKAPITVENGKTRYGNLPANYVVGHDKDGTGYFSFHPLAKIPEDAGIEEITFREFNDIVDTLTNEQLQKRVEERERIAQEMLLVKLAKEEEERKLKDFIMTADDRYKLAEANPDTTLEELKALKIKQLKEFCNEAVYAGFTSQATGFTFGFNLLDQANFTQRMVTIVAGAAGPFLWKTVDAGVQEFTKEQFVTIVNEAENHKIQMQARYWELESFVLAAGTVNEVKLIQWTI